MVRQHKALTALGKAFRFLFILTLMLGLVPARSSANAFQGASSPLPLAEDDTVIYLPFIRDGNHVDLPLMTGVMPGWPSENTINNIMKPMDKWLTGVTGGRSTSIFGTFLTLNLSSSVVTPNVEIPLTLAWESGYTPFVNLPAMTGDTAYEVATSAEYGTLITNWAKSYKDYADGGNRFAYIAPLQEMNGEWVAYGGDPTNYKRAFKRFQDIFAQVGVPRKSIKWVFAPNGWTRPGMPLFEEYYPGDEFVDVTAISAYNFGYCDGGTWKEPAVIYNNPNITDGRYLERMVALAPSKPIFIAQTATSSWRYPGAKSAAEKDRWLRDAYKYLSNQPNVRAVIYFNIFKVCDWQIYMDGVGSAGYKDGVNNNGYEYISPSDLMATDHIFR